MQSGAVHKTTLLLTTVCKPGGACNFQYSVNERLVMSSLHSVAFDTDAATVLFYDRRQLLSDGMVQ